MNDSAHEAPYPTSANRSMGMRRLSLAMLATSKMAEDYQGSQEGQGATRPGQVLAAFKAAAPHLGLSARLVHAIDWLFTFTQPQDWLAGSRPIVWPSSALQREALGLGSSQVKAINRHLVELGLITMKDSPNGKRYGKRDGKGRIVSLWLRALAAFHAHGGVSSHRRTRPSRPRAHAPATPAHDDRPQWPASDTRYRR